jgi:putative ABC transport system permease protein
MIISVVVAALFYFGYNNVLIHHLQFLPRTVMFDYKLGIIILAVITGVASLSGIYPSFILSSRKPVNIFSSNREGSHGRIKLINLLVVGQFVFCIALISTIIMMQKQSGYLLSHTTGFAKDELISIPLNMTIDDGINGDKFDAFAGEIKKIPGVKNISVAFSSPSSVETSEDFPDWEGRAEGQEVKMNWNSVYYDYFETMGVRIVEGRSFNSNFPGDRKNWDNKQASWILNLKAVNEMGITDPIGKEFRAFGFKGPIVGVVEDYNFKSLHSGITPMFFFNDKFHMNEIIVRADFSIPTVIPEIEGVWNRFVPEYPVEFNFVNSQIKALYRQEQNLANTLGLFSIVAIVIACVGLFTLTILSINQRTKEIGIRKVNGAKISEILSMLNKVFIKWIVVAFVIATPVAYLAINKWLESFAYKTELSWWIFALAGVLALGIALLTVSWQSWKAATRNPVEALRYE